MKIIRQPPNPRSEAFARVLMYSYVIAAMLFYFVGPIHERMTQGVQGWMSVEFRCAILALDAFAAYLVVARYRHLGISLLFLNAVVVLTERLTRGLDIGGLMLTAATSFWDVALLLALGMVVKRRSQPTLSVDG